ncbi:MAG: GAK system CofD-like protein [Candidatus Eisenbacteria bacterium]|nr:GAK system CofD-like protein [Candidatus Eisenbacteria bacterium]
MEVEIRRRVRIPGAMKLARCRKCPELGPRLLFFSGGTALRPLSRRLIDYTHNSIHLITPFDSGGSSAALREAFRMPAIGDVRNRLMALADQSLHGNPAVFALFSHRLPKRAARTALEEELDRLTRGRHPLVARIPDPLRKIIRNHLQRFREAMPAQFDLRGASIGNLILAAGYLENRRHLDPVIYIFSRLVQVRGIVRPVTNRHLHLVAELANGRLLRGQHRFAGEGRQRLPARIRRILLTERLYDPRPMRPTIRQKIEARIASADLICYPMGSFFSSVIANLLPRGVGRAIAANPVPKIFVPNLGRDPELTGLSVADQVEVLLDTLRADDPRRLRDEQLLQFLLLDPRSGRYRRGIDTARIEKRGVRILRLPLVTPHSDPLIDESLLLPILISLA